jgi:hypothetical protein
VYCHDIPLHEHIGPDPELRKMLEAITLPKAGPARSFPHCVLLLSSVELPVHTVTRRILS